MEAFVAADMKAMLLGNFGSTFPDQPIDMASGLAGRMEGRGSGMLNETW